MTYNITINNQELEIVIKKHRTSRRMILRYQPKKNCISLTLPRSASIKHGLNFVAEKIEWIAHQIAKIFDKNVFADNKVFSILGEEITIKYVGGRGVDDYVDGTLKIHGAEEFLERRVRVWLHKKCKMEIENYAREFCKALGVKHGKITLRDTSSRWGSCSANGNLSFSWRLIFAPREVLEYVVAHEVSHIKEHNHSPAFWAVVREICPNWKKSRDWLKQHGKTLHKF